jgi:hypothetical protein
LRRSAFAPRNQRKYFRLLRARVSALCRWLSNAAPRGRQDKMRREHRLL